MAEIHLKSPPELPLRYVARAFRDPLTTMIRARERYGDLFRYRAGRNYTYVLNHPKYIGEVLVNRDHFFSENSRLLQAGRDLMGAGLVTTEGTFHRNQRRVLQPAFSHGSVIRYLATVVDYTGDGRKLVGWYGGRL